jgi:hypothetical protein
MVWQTDVFHLMTGTGDTQSVTALADLAKQAQVFNLQNWLHSAEASPGLYLWLKPPYLCTE